MTRLTGKAPTDLRLYILDSCDNASNLKKN